MASFQAMHEILRGCWAYSVRLDVGHSQGTPYLDLQIRFYSRSGKLSNVHFMELPLFNNKIVETQFKTYSQALTVVDPDWKSKVVLIGTDKYHTMNGRISGVQTRVEEAVEFLIVRVWCGLHQIDLVTQKAYLDLFEDTFVLT